MSRKIETYIILYTYLPTYNIHYTTTNNSIKINILLYIHIVYCGLYTSDHSCCTACIVIFKIYILIYSILNGNNMVDILHA